MASLCVLMNCCVTFKMIRVDDYLNEILCFYVSHVSFMTLFVVDVTFDFKMVKNNSIKI